MHACTVLYCMRRTSLKLSTSLSPLFFTLNVALVKRLWNVWENTEIPRVLVTDFNDDDRNDRRDFNISGENGGKGGVIIVGSSGGVSGGNSSGGGGVGGGAQ